MMVLLMIVIVLGVGNVVNGVVLVDVSVGKGMVVDVVKDKVLKGDNVFLDELFESEEEDLELIKE